MAENLRKRLVLPMTENLCKRLVLPMTDGYIYAYKSKFGLRIALAALEREIEPFSVFKKFQPKSEQIIPVRLISELFMQ